VPPFEWPMLKSHDNPRDDAERRNDGGNAQTARISVGDKLRGRPKSVFESGMQSQMKNSVELNPGKVAVPPFEWPKAQKLPITGAVMPHVRKG
jgi:hypothetical protein